MSATYNSGEYQYRFGHRQGRHGRGPSSFWMHDPEVIFGEVRLKSGDTFLDLGCGPGDYTIYAAKIVGDDGAVYAVDREGEMIKALLKEADSLSLENVIGVIADITTPLSLKDHCADVCLLSTVLHIPDISKESETLLNEIRRVLKPGGCLVIIECKKQEVSFGPPIHMRLSPEETEALTTPCGFEKTGFTDLGYNYMIQFKLSRE